MLDYFVGVFFIIIGLVFIVIKTANIGGENDPEPVATLKGWPAKGIGLGLCAIGVFLIIVKP
jgi:hypothetical protein